MKRFSFPLTYKIAAAFLAVLLPVVVVLLAGLGISRRVAERQILDNLLHLAEEREAFVLQYLELNRSRLLDFSSDGTIVGAMEAFSRGDSSAAAPLGEYMRRYKLPLFRQIYSLNIVADPSGKIVSSTAAAMEGADVSAEAYFNAGKKGLSITEVTRGHSGMPELAVSAPIRSRRGNGALLGVITGFTEIGRLSEIFSGEYIAMLGGTRETADWGTLDIYLVNRGALMLTESRFMEGAVLRQRVDTLPVKNCLERGSETVGIYRDYRGVEVAGAASCLRPLGWTLVAEVDTSEVFAPLERMRLYNAAAIAAVTALIGALVLYFIRIVVGQLKSLVDGARRVSSGDYEVEIPVRTSDEIGLLAGAFNEMVGSVKARTLEIEKGEASYRLLLESLEEGVWVLDSSGVTEYVNPNMAAMLGYGTDEMTGRHLFEFIEPEMRASAEELLGRRRKGLKDKHEFRFRRKDGPEVYVSVTASPIMEGGEYRGVIAGIADITARKAAEDALTESEERFRSILDNMGNVVYMKDLEGRHIFVNRLFEIVAGRQRPDIYGKTVFDLMPEKAAAEFDDNDRTVLKYDRPMEFEERLELADGTHHYISIKFPLKDTSGRTYAICGVSTDITSLKRSEAEVRKLNVELEARVGERTMELQRAMDGLAAANREMEAFTYSVAHDLRNPLRLIDGFSIILMKKHRAALDREAQDHIERIRGAVKRMGQLIDDLLNLSYVMRAEIKYEPVDLSAMARAIATDLKKADPERKAEVRVEDGLSASGEEKLLRMVLENLIGNAWKFTSRVQDPVIEFGSSGLKDGSEVFFVRDNGAGFDMRHVSEIFEPFHRLHPADEYPGTGIGLATVARVVNRHGGEVWAEGAPGSGACFYFTLGRRG